MDPSIEQNLSNFDGIKPTILIVEDEMLIRFAISDYLRNCGFQVVEAADASEAVKALESDLVTIDLVFSDVQMPGPMNGFGLARWIRSNRPELPVILTSGAVRTAELAEELCDLGPIEIKPYDSASIAQRMRRSLGLLAAPRGVPSND